MLPNYQGGIFTASRNWAQSNSNTLKSFIKGYIAGLAWCLDNSNYENAKTILLENMPTIKPAAVDQVLSKTLSETTGLTPKAKLELTAIQTVLDLRRKFGDGSGMNPDPLHYIDLSYYNEALKSLSDQ